MKGVTMPFIEVVIPLVMLIFSVVIARWLWHRKVKHYVMSGNYTMHYQPMVLEGNIVALEALISLPAELIDDGQNKEDVIDYIERHAMGNSFTPAVFRTVLRDYIRHFRESTALIISINVPPQDICDDSLVNYALDSLRNAGIPAGTFMLEVTERTRIPSKSLFIHNLNRLREGGFLLAIDDAGKGLSEEIIALRFPFDYVKTEIAMLKKERTDFTDNSLWNAIQDARTGVIVERIQTAGDAGLAKKMCKQPLLQGWYFFQAIPARDAAELLLQPVDPTNQNIKRGHNAG